ncbi:hypothetical protein PNP59_11470 [Halobacterium salinarum]|uniref:hypothetical protein n=1 Tax=Halobacterium salinarum TaxID=2242 RepID=UPI0025541990|nr:hypothetical protein [Halobacterium salinarum]MDL0131544.1 hypothetical protein [Halobacterium salinarum]
MIPTPATLPFIPDAWTIPFIPQNWNISLGIGAGLTAISLLSLLIARQLLVQLTSPEQLLTQIAQDVTVEGLSSASDSKDGSSINRPQRTPLLTIERILESADERSDEYTVQSAIYEMHKAIVDLITNAEFDLSAQVNADEAVLSTDGVSILLDRWKTCLEKGEHGPTRRRQFVGQYHRVLLLALMNKEEYELAEKNLEGLTGLCTAAYKNGSTDPTLLLEYEPVFTAAVDVNSASILRQVETELSTVSKVILDTINTDSVQDNQRELLSIVLATRVKNIGTVTTADKTDPHIRRNYAETTLDQLNNTLYDCFSLFDGIEAAAANKQNLLTDFHRALVPVIHDCAPADTAITRQLLIAFFELSVKLDRDYSEVIDTLLETGDSNSEIEQQFHDICENSYSPEFTAVNASEVEVESLMLKTKQKYSEYNG